MTARNVTLAIIVLGYILAACSAFGLTESERKIATQMRDVIVELRAAKDAADARIASISDSLAQSSNQCAALTVELLSQQAAVKVLSDERDSLKDRVAELGKTIDSQANHIRDLTKKVDAEKAEAHRNAKERDVIIWVFAIVVTGLSVSLMRPLLASVPPPYGILAWPVAVIAGFLACYGFGRVVLAQVASALPF